MLIRRISINMRYADKGTHLIHPYIALHFTATLYEVFNHYPPLPVSHHSTSTGDGKNSWHEETTQDKKGAEEEEVVEAFLYLYSIWMAWKLVYVLPVLGNVVACPHLGISGSTNSFSETLILCPRTILCLSSLNTDFE